MLVYRVETFDGSGPYKGLITRPGHKRRSTVIPDSIHQTKDHPGIYYDFPNSAEIVAKKMVSGFATKKQFSQWFSDESRDFLTGLTVLQTYNVPKKHVLFGASGKQVVFDKSKAKLVKTLPL